MKTSGSVPLRRELARRLGIGRASQPEDVNAVRARFAMLGWVSGGVLAILFALFTRLDGVDRVGLVLVGVGAFVMALIMLVAFDRMPEWAFASSAPIAVVAVTFAVYFIHRPASPIVILYVPGVVSGFYFHGRTWAAMQTALTGVGYGIVLAIEQPAGAIAWWLLTVSVLAILGDLMGRVRDRVLGLVASLEEAARTDPLTGLLNRRAFQKEFDLELERARRSSTSMSLLVGDLDHFKHVNDRQGHQMGDAALCAVAEIFAEQGRRVDVAVRMGGEEFALLLTGTDDAGAYMLAERMRSAVQRRFEDEPVQLTISFGIASYPAHGVNVDGLMRAADHALYTAKALGRDRTVVCATAVADAISPRTDQSGTAGDRAAA